ncbi:PAS domain-containing protein [Jiella sp. MQZ9-1]|uniref:PAS domain-containing protein n=1 Tax=Jiella flava TaxID=2816857 RepID=A0A939FZ06_9HYPH|nr:PAS domain-containing protein [Jiella flava]MBO0664185.1 PAS domain-containing protein [Jiella flava]MCD2472832.1 PAS domain-containing protein [Jiella flava]
MDKREDERPESFGVPTNITTAALAKLPLALVLTNPHIEDNPIIYANTAFAEITGYAPAATIGRNCRFLQGDETDPEHARQIGDALRQERDISIDILNYRADGTKFINRLMITPLYDENDRLQCFLGVQRDMSEGASATNSRTDGQAAPIDATLGEIQHRVKNHLSMIVGMIRMQARAETSKESFTALARRIESLQLLYQEMTESGVGSSRSENVPLGAYVSRIAATIGHLDGRRSVRINVDCDAIDMKVDRAARIGLLFSELLTNALKHAFDGREAGLVEARLKMLSSGVIRLTVTDDGIGLPDDSNWPYSGRQPVPLDEREIQRITQDAQVAESAPNEARQLADSMGLSRHADAEGGDAGSEIVETGDQAKRRQKSRESEGGLGGRITVSLVRGLDAEIDVNSMTTGTTVTVDIPPE